MQQSHVIRFSVSWVSSLCHRYQLTIVRHQRKFVELQRSHVFSGEKSCYYHPCMLDTLLPKSSSGPLRVRGGSGIFNRQRVYLDSVMGTMSVRQFKFQHHARIFIRIPAHFYAQRIGHDPQRIDAKIRYPDYAIDRCGVRTDLLRQSPRNARLHSDTNKPGTEPGQDACHVNGPALRRCRCRSQQMLPTQGKRHAKNQKCDSCLEVHRPIQ